MDATAILGKTDLELLGRSRASKSIMTNDLNVMRKGSAEHVEETITGSDGRISCWLATKAPFRGPTRPRYRPRRFIDRHTKGARPKSVRGFWHVKWTTEQEPSRSSSISGTVDTSDEIDAFKRSVSGRIQALARAHSLLAAGRWDGVELGELIRDELAPFVRSNVIRAHISGPRLWLRPAATQALALTVHELATNAVKYGALSNEAGCIDVTWSVDSQKSDRLLTLQWSERGGPKPQYDQDWFGSTLIRTSVERQLGGKLEQHWYEQGLCCRICIAAETVGRPRKRQSDARARSTDK